MFYRMLMTVLILAATAKSQNADRTHTKHNALYAPRPEYPLAREHVAETFDRSNPPEVLRLPEPLRDRLTIVQVPVPHHPRELGRRSGARPRAVIRAIRELVRYRRRWR